MDLKKNIKIQITAIRKHGKDLHREIDNNIKKLEADLNEMDTELLTVLTKKEDEIAHISSEISKNIADLKNLIASNDVSVVSAHKSRNAEFRRFISKLKISLPRFTSQRINREMIQLGCLSVVSIETTEHNFVTNSPGIDSSSSDRPTIAAVSFVIKEINTTSGESSGLRSVSCLNDENIWTCGQDNIMQLYSLQGKLVKSIKTKAGNRPEDIEVTRNGDLVNTDENDRTVNAVNNSQIETLIKTNEWTPSNVCNTFTGDFLILLYNDDSRQTKVVRYSGSSEKQNIQFNNGHALYSSHGSKCICENRNLDICVSDWGSNTVVVVDRAGKLRFVYTGPPSKTKDSFSPRGVTTDSQSQILIADYYNNRIHIIDQDGFFIRFIEKWELQYPCGLCVDTKDNLIVAEYRTGKVKKIQYDV